MTVVESLLNGLRGTVSYFADALKCVKEKPNAQLAALKRALQDTAKAPVDTCARCSSLALEMYHTMMLDVYSFSARIAANLAQLPPTTYSSAELAQIIDHEIQTTRFHLHEEDRRCFDPFGGVQDIHGLLSAQGREFFQLPDHLERSFKWLYKHGYTATGIFRLNGAAETVRLYARYPFIIEYSERNTINIAASLKLYLRELPEPIFNAREATRLIAATKELDEMVCSHVKDVEYEAQPMYPSPHLAPSQPEFTPVGKFVDTVKALLSTNPVATTVLRYFVELSLKIASGPSLMSINGLGICLGPCVLCTKADNLSDSSVAGMFFEEVTNNAAKIFNVRVGDD